MKAGDSRKRLEDHDAFALSIDKAAEAGGVEAARVLLELIERTRGFLQDVADRKVEFPEPISNVQGVLKKHGANMMQLWEAAKRLPDRLPYIRIGWEYPAETAKERISKIVRTVMYDYVAQFAEAQGMITHLHVSYKQHDVWGLLEDLAGVVTSKYGVELAAQRPQPAERLEEEKRAGGPAPGETSLADASVRQEPRISKKEANVLARHLLKKNPFLKARELAKQIRCSVGLVSQLPAWQAVQEKRKAGWTPRNLRAVRLTEELQENLSQGERDDVLKQLIKQQDREMKVDPSPFAKGPKRPRFVQRRKA